MVETGWGGDVPMDDGSGGDVPMDDNGSSGSEAHDIANNEQGHTDDEVMSMYV